MERQEDKMGRKDMELLTLVLLRYGKCLTDDNIELPPKKTRDYYNYIRIRCIEYDGFIYYHKMCDGAVADIQKIGRTKRS